MAARLVAARLVEARLVEARLVEARLGEAPQQASQPCDCQFIFLSRD